ncbi:MULTISPECIES: glycosyltransferase [Hydrogenophaga]|uniref:Glycosyl transferase, group 1 n=1 Tax=Hydrogenophaga intermedia TaxID=65786 RepID=A0A1L1PM22_HYDIT|nr:MULTISPECIES: glycosyltransferase [Hydrogenophaga]AOS79401.1 glycosyl transferase family 1 [Hydrogenophaga sp. PBC]TMU70570.1 glycosyltransferase [Hydrogenophaga intermedia]CDN89854.1 Glycosyl transferase, group 1 [Hydrogenophaga intermedia]
MRVLFVSSDPHLPQITGGLQTTTHDLCLAIRDMGAEAAVLCGQALDPKDAGAGSATTSDERLGYLVMRSPRPAQDLAMAAAAWAADAIVVQSGSGLATMVLASLDTGRATALYLHNVEISQLGGNLAPDPSFLFLANSSFTAQRWQALYGIHCEVIAPIVQGQSYLADSTGDKVLFVNPHPMKGVERLFELAAACPELPFLVMESWNVAPQWRTHCLQRANRLGNVEWRSPSTNMRKVYGQSRVLLMPSVWEESFGRTVVEAQLNGLPVLASQRGALPDLVGAGGATLSPDAPLHEWAAALRRLYDPLTSEAERLTARRQGAAHVAGTQATVAKLLGLLSVHVGATQDRRESEQQAEEERRERMPARRDQQPAPSTSAAVTATGLPGPTSAREIAPRQPRLEDCTFYHWYTLPDGREMPGIYDMRGQASKYLGDFDFDGRTVLEVGPASGFLSLHMEAAGAEVTCLEPPMSHLWDIVPFDGFDTAAWRRQHVRNIEGVRNSFWYAHHTFGSRVRMIEADPYDLPEDVGPYDVSVLAAVLLHTRRPFDMLQSVAERTRKTVIVTEVHDPTLGHLPLQQLRPRKGAEEQVDTWWTFTPQYFVSALALLGFTQAQVSYHRLSYPSEKRELPMFTVIGERPGA